MRAMFGARRPRPGATFGPGTTAGFNLIEVTLTMAIVLTILLGVMASISTASMAEMSASENVASQLLMSQVLEEVKSNEFEDLLSFNGQYVTSGTNRADISVVSLSTDLVRIQVSVTSTAFPDVVNSAVLLQAALE
ncbi:MAG: hypothetical protein HY721_24430 [Planctomycetes bacterium]|nr:hypothetical protein [Planctomycetota bacterium]